MSLKFIFLLVISYFADDNKIQTWDCFYQSMEIMYENYGKPYESEADYYIKTLYGLETISEEVLAIYLYDSHMLNNYEAMDFLLRQGALFERCYTRIEAEPRSKLMKEFNGSQNELFIAILLLYEPQSIEYKAQKTLTYYRGSYLNLVKCLFILIRRRLEEFKSPIPTYKIPDFFNRFINNAY